MRGTLQYVPLTTASTTALVCFYSLVNIIYYLLNIILNIILIFIEYYLEGKGFWDTVVISLN